LGVRAARASKAGWWNLAAQAKGMGNELWISRCTGIGITRGCGGGMEGVWSLGEKLVSNIRYLDLDI
jgi:hypothetical protein